MVRLRTDNGAQAAGWPEQGLFRSHPAGYRAAMHERGWGEVDGSRRADQARSAMHVQAMQPPIPAIRTLARPTRSVALLLVLLIAVSAIVAATTLPAMFVGSGVAALGPAGDGAAAEVLSSATRHAVRPACADVDDETADRIALRTRSNGSTGADGRPDGALAGTRAGSGARPRGRRDTARAGGSGPPAASARQSRRRPISEAASATGTKSTSVPPGGRSAVPEATGGRP